MFPFDVAALPQLFRTRKALIVVDLQRDFLGPSDGDATGALPITQPDGFIARTVALSEAFRNGVGDVVWVQSVFEEARSVDQEAIITSDLAPQSDGPLARRGRRRRGAAGRSGGASEPLSVTTPSSVSTAKTQASPDPEAFLSHHEPFCVQESSQGAEMAPVVRGAVRRGDLMVTKSHYSAFSVPHLLRLLRGKMVMEVFICGSLANVGVYTTALDAAGHGMSITIVEDCCGYRVESRQIRAMRNLMELTGCEIVSCQELLQAFQLEKQKGSSKKAIESKKGNETKTGAETKTETEIKTGPSEHLCQDAEIEPGPDGEKPKSPDLRGTATPSPVATNDLSDIVSAMSQLDLPSDCQNSVAVDKDATPVTSPDKTSSQTPLTASHLPAPSPDAAKAINIEENPDTESSLPQEKEKPQTLKPITELNPSAAAAPICEGDTTIVTSFLPPDVEAGIFDRLRDEVQWEHMSHIGGAVPRLVAVQGAISPDDGSEPVYRHPSDEAPPLFPFTPTVLVVKAAVEQELGHPVNHALIQLYRSGTDCISEHSDKTIDICKGSYIANVSFGAERVMTFRSKRAKRNARKSSPSAPQPSPGEQDEKASDASPHSRQSQRIALPHNSLCRMGPATNMKWLHGIRPDRRADRDKTAAELAYNGVRLSLTFRSIATYTDRGRALIWGQGATSKTRAQAQPVVNGHGSQARSLLHAFSEENLLPDFDWEAHYGGGFDVLHLRTTPRFFASPDDLVVSLRIALMLSEYGVCYDKGSVGSTRGTSEGATADRASTAHSSALPPPGATVKFVDDDANLTVVEGDVAIMLYLDSVHGPPRTSSDSTTGARQRAEMGACLTRFQRALGLGELLRSRPELSREVQRELVAWDAKAKDAAESGFIAGGASISLADFALWPALHILVGSHGSAAVFSDGQDDLPSLRRYYDALAARPSVKRALALESKGAAREEGGRT